VKFVEGGEVVFRGGNGFYCRKRNINLCTGGLSYALCISLLISK
jgi:hypothetical protein